MYSNVVHLRRIIVYSLLRFPGGRCCNIAGRSIGTQANELRILNTGYLSGTLVGARARSGYVMFNCDCIECWVWQCVAGIMKEIKNNRYVWRFNFWFAYCPCVRRDRMNHKRTLWLELVLEAENKCYVQCQCIVCWLCSRNNEIK